MALSRPNRHDLTQTDDNPRILSAWEALTG
jgi:hypothetical protein